MIKTKKDMANMVREYGFLPMFENEIPGFSIEEHTAREAWFPENGEGVWEWKGPVIQETGALYGKFFRGKAGFILPELFLDFANYRRDGYDFDARYDDGLASRKDKEVYDLLEEHGDLLSGDLRQLGGFGKGKKGGFEGIVTRLQMQCYFITADFEYRVDKQGKPYGWGVARLSTPERRLGRAFTEKVYQRSPEESKQRIFDSLKKLLPNADEQAIRRLIG